MLYPANKIFSQLYGAEQSAGGQAFCAQEQSYADAVTPSYVGTCENLKQKVPLLQVKWMKDGKRVVTGSNSG